MPLAITKTLPYAKPQVREPKKSFCWKHFCECFKAFFLELGDIIRNVIPLRIKWKRQIKAKQITEFPLKSTVGKTTRRASLYLHGKVKPDNSTAILFMHGHQGHPANMLKLIDGAHEFGTVFSMRMKYDELKPQFHRSFIEQSADKIQQLVGKGFKKIIVVGHSAGAIHSSERAFVLNDERLRVISIAGRLKGEKSCHPDLRPIVDNVYKGIMSKEEHQKRLRIIYAEKDWLIRKEASAILPTAYPVKKARHLNILYKKETLSKMKEYLSELSQL